MPKNEAFLGENGSKMSVFNPSKFLCSTCAQLLQQTIKTKILRENQSISEPKYEKSPYVYLPKSHNDNFSVIRLAPYKTQPAAIIRGGLTY